MSEGGKRGDGKDFQWRYRPRGVEGEGQAVRVDMGVKYQERLDELRELSVRLNHLLQQELDGRELPYSTKHTHDKVLRLSLQVRPEFLHSDEDKSERYSAADDQITFFIHLKKNGQLQTERFHSLMKSHDVQMFILCLPGKTLSKTDDLASVVNSGDWDKVVNFVVAGLEKNPYTDHFAQSQRLENLDQARAYFAHKDQFFNQDWPILRNLATGALKSFLHHQTEELLSTVNDRNSSPQERSQIIAQELSRLGKEFLDITFKRYEADLPDGKDIPLREAIVYHKNTTAEQILAGLVKQLVKDNKPAIYGWEIKDKDPQI